VKNSAKVTLLSFNRMTVFLHSAMPIVAKDEVLEARQCNRCVCVGKGVRKGGLGGLD